MNEHRTNEVEPQAAEMRLPAVEDAPAIGSVEQRASGASDANLNGLARLKCVDVQALVMLDSSLGG